MHFQRLRLIGFKSFVDPTDLLIEPGLTGIVGPNGCGKSNLVEALRWVMGETSPRQMRGREMDDVIFSGSATRPPRNHAEVQVLLDNAARTAPAAFNDDVEIEVSRRIERGSGSVYRINGRELRARDVQLLFADETTGARSTALVGQGQVGALISAKPSERRALLDEAAAITGLHSRRHEAELRLRAAEANLERLDDVTGALEAQLQGLKRQARQAGRYRRLGERIRATEATLLHRRYRVAEEAVARTAAARDAAERAVAALEQTAAGAATEQADAAAALPPLREAQAIASAKLHRLEVAQVELEAEERRLADARATLESRLSQIDADVERETALAGDADQALARLESERDSLTAARDGERDSAQAVQSARDQAAKVVAALEHDADGLAARLGAAEARGTALARQVEEIDGRLERLRARAAEVDGELAGLAGGTENGATLGDAEAAVTAAGAEVAAKRTGAESAERERIERQEAEGAARESLQAAETAHAALAAEEAALAELLGGDKSGRWPAMIDEISVEAGFETALGAALGDDLSASPDADAPLHWRDPEIDGAEPPLPAGAEPLARFVTAPAAMARRLSQVGVVAAGDGSRLWGALAQGQRLVSREGALWRWDGFAVAPEAETPAAVRLRQNNRLTALRREIKKSEARRQKTADKLAAGRAALDRAAADEAGARASLRGAEEALDGARETLAGAAAAAAAEASRRDNLSDAATRLAADLKEAAEQHAAAVAAVAELESDDDGSARLEGLRTDLSARRAELAEHEGAHDRVRREAAARRDRLAAVDVELRSWRGRADGAKAHLSQLAKRRTAASAELTAFADRPAEITAARGALLDQLQDVQGERALAGDALAEAETRLAALDRRSDEARSAVAGAREERVRCEGALERATASRDEVVRAVSERLGCAPGDLAGLAAADDDEAADPEEIEARLARLVAQREAIGPVNLRAEIEATEVGEQLAALRDERADLEAAIGRLRQAIARLNREGRERIEVAFETINKHFEAMFTRLFGGGSAHLSLVGSDDPLEAGLEVMASPPGKRLQALSLLSGGEQALSALALSFAVFLTNPTPICVLDEVDAPLDDANVARFCDLVAEIAHGSATRFLIVTHNPVTMPRMDRLFGVTMSERGVSQLVSVDLAEADAFSDPAQVPREHQLT